MKCCSAPSGYGEFFSEQQARRDAKRYLRRGLDAPARWIVDAVLERGIEGQTVLEPGGGVGAIQVELLKAGASRSAVIELSPAYDEVAGELARDAGVDDRIERRRGDFVTDDVDEADVVVLHRVVCCYPDCERLLGVAAGKARRTLVYTYPPRNLASRLVVGTCNAWLRLRGNEFRVFTHSPRAMADAVRRAGFEPFEHRRRGIWRGVAFARRDP